MPFQHLYDIDMSPDGDLLVDESGDFALAQGESVIRSDMVIRIMTQTPELAPYPWIGADLHDFFGSPNNEVVAAQIQDRIHDSLVAGGNLKASDLDVQIMPVGESILLFVFVNESQVVEAFEINLALSTLRRVDPDAD